MALTHTVFPGYVPDGYFSNENVSFVRGKVEKILRRDFVQRVRIPTGDVVNVMLRVLTERLEAIPMMNQRAIMYIVGEFRAHQTDVNKHLRWADAYPHTQILQDATAGVSRFDPLNIKLANRLGQPKVGGRVAFFFT